MFERKTRKKSIGEKLNGKNLTGKKSIKRTPKRSPKKVVRTVRKNKLIRKLGGNSVTILNDNMVDDFKQIVLNFKQDEDVGIVPIEQLFYKIVFAYAMNVPKDPMLEFEETYQKYYENYKDMMDRFNVMKKRFEKYSNEYAISENLQNQFLEVLAKVTDNKGEFTKLETQFYDKIINLAELFQTKTNDEFKKRYKAFFPNHKQYLEKMKNRFEKYLNSLNNQK